VHRAWRRAKPWERSWPDGNGSGGWTRSDGSRLRRYANRHSSRWRRAAGTVAERTARRQQRKRIPIGMSSTGRAHAEVQMWGVCRAASAGPDRADRLAGDHGLSCSDGDPGEVQVGGVEATVGSPHGDGQAGVPGRPGEAHRSRRGRDHRRANRRRDVDAAVLLGGVRVAAEVVGGQQPALHGPAPAALRAGRLRWAATSHETGGGEEYGSSEHAVERMAAPARDGLAVVEPSRHDAFRVGVKRLRHSVNRFLRWPRCRTIG
jgi:hypothetical protein